MSEIEATSNPNGSYETDMSGVELSSSRPWYEFSKDEVRQADETRQAEMTATYDVLNSPEAKDQEFAAKPPMPTAQPSLPE